MRRRYLSQTRTGPAAAGGMTLIEVTIVIAILATLMAIMVIAMQPAGEQAKLKAATALMNKLKPGLTSRVSWFPTSGLTDKIAVFPQTIAECSDLSGATTEHESAECLYWMLLGDGARGTDQLDAAKFNSKEIRDTDGDGFNEFVDPWGIPVRFERSPTRAAGSVRDDPRVTIAGPDRQFGGSDDITSDD